MPQFPRSAFDLTSGLVYFARMCDKIRLHAAGELPPAYHEFLGKGFDGRLCNFLRIDYGALKEKVLAGASDEEALAWCEGFFGPLNDMHRTAYNAFATKRGLRDDGAENLGRQKEAANLADRLDIDTFFDFYEVDEGRRP